jgi:hypothetical protein
MHVHTDPATGVDSQPLTSTLVHGLQSARNLLTFLNTARSRSCDGFPESFANVRVVSSNLITRSICSLEVLSIAPVGGWVALDRAADLVHSARVSGGLKNGVLGCRNGAGSDGRPILMRFLRTRNSTLTQLLAVLVAVCLIVKPLVVALHLAHHDHTSALVAGDGGHSHGDGHGHAHDHSHHHHDEHALGSPVEDASGASEGDPDHPPHPASDHDDLAKVRVTTGGPQSSECGAAVSHWDPVVVPQVVRNLVRVWPATGPPRTDRRTDLLATTVLRI